MPDTVPKKMLRDQQHDRLRQPAAVELLRQLADAARYAEAADLLESVDLEIDSGRFMAPAPMKGTKQRNAVCRRYKETARRPAWHCARKKAIKWYRGGSQAT